MSYDRLHFQLISAITSHFGETLVRLRFTEYVGRFVRLASRYEEVASGSTALGFSTAPFVEGSLGKGIVFSEEAVAARELATNASRIEGWRRTKSYQYCILVRSARSDGRRYLTEGQDVQKLRATETIRGFDLSHQLCRLRLTKNLPDSEVELIVRTIAENVRSYEQVVEVCRLLPCWIIGKDAYIFLV